MPDWIFAVLFNVAFPIYRALHKKRAYGRTERHLENAEIYLAGSSKSLAKKICTARDVFRGIYWNALDSYRGLARFKSVTDRIVYENEDIIRGAIAEGTAAGMPIAAISIHQGPFELLHRSLCRYSENVQLVTDSVGDQALRRLLKALRSDKHLTEYHPEDSRALVRNLFKTKGILAMVVDQGKNTKGNKVKLFGQSSTLYLRLPQLVNQMGAGVVTFRTFTRPAAGSSKSRFGSSIFSRIFSGVKKEIVIRFEKFYPPKYDECRTASDATLVDSIAAEVETWIAEHPAEWSWNYHGNFK